MKLKVNENNHTSVATSPLSYLIRSGMSILVKHFMKCKVNQHRPASEFKEEKKSKNKKKSTLLLFF